MHTSDGIDLAVHDLGGSGDDRLLVQGVGLCAQMTGRSGWICLNDSVLRAGRVPALEVQ